MLFEHGTEEIGHIDPYSMRVTRAGLIVAGEVDRSSERGLQVWRQIKRGTAGFSIGYLSESRPRGAPVALEDPALGVGGRRFQESLSVSRPEPVRLSVGVA